MSLLAGLVRAIEALNEALGRVFTIFGPACVVLCFLVVLLRYGFSIGFIWMQELYVWFHAALFMLGAAYTLQHGEHVRVDAFYARISARGQALVDIVGTLIFMFPFLGVLGWLGWKFTLTALQFGETSSQPGGMGAIWVLKAAIPAACLLTGLQGLSLLLRRVLELSGHPDFPLRHTEEHLPHDAEEVVGG